MRVTAALMVVFCVLVVGMPAASARTDGLAYKEDTLFTIGAESVQVTTEAVMTNTTSERRRGNTIYYSFFDSFIVVVPTGAEDVTITSRGRTLSSTTSELDDAFELHTARLPSQLRSGQTRSFTVTYTLPRGEIRGEGLFFSNPAFHAFPMWSFSDPGTGSLKLRVPEDAELSEFGERLRRVGVEDGYVEWVPTDFDTPEDVFIFVTATLDDALDIQTFNVAGQTIELRTWPGDTAWAKFAEDTIHDGLPTLESLIGLPVPEQSTLEITESVTPYFFGYAGWYDSIDTSIEVGNELDKTVMIHELSHAWFNDGLFTERWISEGLAEEFTWRTQNELGWEPEPVPTKPLLASSGAMPIVEWGHALTDSTGDTELRATEEYGYETSWYVVHEMAETIGLGGIQAVLASADGNTTAYVGDDSSEVTVKVGDWRRILDLAAANASREEEVVLDELFTTFVVRESDVARIEARRTARDAYSAFGSRHLGWRVPDDLRSAMNVWKFDDAEAIMTEAAHVQDRYVEVIDAATEADLDLSDRAQAMYEAEVPDFAQAMEILDAQEAAIPAVAAVRETSTRQLTTQERWGIGETTRVLFVTHAEVAFSVDEPGEIEVAQLAAENLLARAAVAGATRILWAKIGGGALGAIVLLLLLMGIRQRRRKTEERANRDITNAGEVVLAA